MSEQITQRLKRNAHKTYTNINHLKKHFRADNKLPFDAWPLTLDENGQKHDKHGVTTTPMVLPRHAWCYHNTHGVTATPMMLPRHP